MLHFASAGAIGAMMMLGLLLPAMVGTSGPTMQREISMGTDDKKTDEDFDRDLEAQVNSADSGGNGPPPPPTKKPPEPSE